MSVGFTMLSRGGHSQLCRELWTIMLEANWDWDVLVRDRNFLYKLLQLFSGLAHEKGVESCFKGLRRLISHGSENNYVTTDRVYGNLQTNAETSYPNFAHLETGLKSLASNRDHANAFIDEHLDAPRAAHKGYQLAGKNYVAAGATWACGKLQMSGPGYSTTSAYNNSANTARQVPGP